VDGGQITFTAPTSGASATFSSGGSISSGGSVIVATIVAGKVEVTAIANSTVGGPYIIEAGTKGATAPVSFTATNAQVGPQSRGHLFRIGPFISQGGSPLLRYQIDDQPAITFPITPGVAFSFDSGLGNDTYIINLSKASGLTMTLPQATVNVVAGGTDNQISIVAFPADPRNVNSQIDKLVSSDLLSFTPQAIPPNLYFVASAQPQMNQIQFGLSTTATPASQTGLAHFVLKGQPTIPQITAPKGVILLGDPSVTAFSLFLSNSNPGQFGTRFVTGSGQQTDPLSFASPGVTALGMETTHQLLITDIGSAGRNFTLEEAGTGTALIGYDQSISQIVILPKPRGTAPDTVTFLDSNPDQLIKLTTTPGNPQIILTDKGGSGSTLLTISGAALGSAPAIEATAGQPVSVQLIDPGKRSNRTIAVVGPTSGAGTLDVTFPTSNVVFRRLLTFPRIASSASGAIMVRYRDGATYTVNYTNMTPWINGSQASSGAIGRHRTRRPARSHIGISAVWRGSAITPPHAPPASVLARSNGSRRSPLGTVPPAWRGKIRKSN
jgi:hypothetical protein